MATYLWSPHDRDPLRVRRNPQAVVYEPVSADDARAPDVTFTPNGGLAGPADEALAQLQAAGPRGAAALGAMAGLLFSGWKAAVVGGFLGYYSGKYLTNFASKALAVVAVTKAVA